MVTEGTGYYERVASIGMDRLAEVSLVQWIIFLLIIHQGFVDDLFEVQGVESLRLSNFDLYVPGIEDLSLVLRAAHHK